MDLHVDGMNLLYFKMNVQTGEGHYTLKSQSLSIS